MTTNSEQTARDKAADRVKKLLQWVANARNTTKAAENGEAEIEAFTKAARKLMEEHNLEEYEVMTKDADVRQTAYDSIRQEDALTMARLVELHDKRMATVAAEICDCKVFTRTDHTYAAGKLKKTETIVFYGLPTDLAVCKAFFAELRASIKAMATMKYGSKWGTVHREYAAGFVATLLVRARKMKSTVANCVAIVLCKDGLLIRWAGEKLNLRTVYDNSRKDFSRSDAYREGREDGKQFDLGVDRRLTK